MTKQPLLNVTGLHKKYRSGRGYLHVLKGIDLTIDQGQFVSIMGPSGAGKSTLLHILGGLDNPDQGSVVWQGASLAQLRDAQRARFRERRVGFVFQFYHLLGDLTALENVVLPARISRMKFQAKFGRWGRRLRERGMELLKEVGLADRAHHMPSQLSGGEQQRVAIARALMNEPEILLCDEPTGNLDSCTGTVITTLLHSVHKEKGVTLVVVTHEQEIADNSDTVFHIRDGVLI